MPESRDLVFSRVSVDYLVRGGARITWSLRHFFWEPGSYRFQLQVGDTANPDADDWEDVGGTVVDLCYATDDEPRTHSKWRMPHYRVRLVTDAGEHISPPTAASGLLSQRDWLTARAAFRRERLHNRLSACWRGWLLRRKWRGDEPPRDDPVASVRDFITGDLVGLPDTQTYGTAFTGGYYAPMPLQLELDGDARFIAQDPQVEATDSQMELRGRAAAIPELQHRDVFVHAGSDRRYEIQQVRDIAVWNGVPLIALVVLRLLPATDIAYDVPV